MDFIGTTKTSMGVFLTTGACLIVIIVIAMVILGLRKRKIKKNQIFYKDMENAFGNYHDTLRKKLKIYNIVLGVLGGLLAIFVIAVFVVNFVVVFKANNNTNNPVSPILNLGNYIYE